MPRTKKPVLDRLWERTVIDHASGCWVWTGALFSGTGYGSIYVDGRNRTTHSVAADLFDLGERGPGMTIDHVAERGCIYRACWNPAHLEVVTARENNLRGSGRAAVNARKTHCDQGHEFTPANTRIYRGSRYCRACARARAAREYRERRAAEGRTVLPMRERTHCPQGHPYDEANTAVSGGRRSCRACNREKARRYYRSKRGV